MGMTAIMAVLAVAIAIVVVAAVFTALDVFLALSAEKATRRECLLCETKKFEIMTDIMFAKEHLGEYFQYRNYRVRVIGYDATGIGNSVIIDYPQGWRIENTDSVDVIHEELCETGKCYYVSWGELM